MYHDVGKLRDFYYRSVLGRNVQTRLQAAVRDIWPDANHEIVVGYGFASPILRPFWREASHMVNLMPSEQGVMAWPPGEANVSTMCNESVWPLGASSVDKIIALHALENAVHVSAVLAEFWRVLVPEGGAIIIFANRTGIWSNNESTPFGHGRPFGMMQFEQLVKQHGFEIKTRNAALFGSPWKTALGYRMSNITEKFRERFKAKMLAGVWVIELQKQSLNRSIALPKKEPIFATPDMRPAGALRKIREPNPEKNNVKI